jgi:hypothetical protein
MGVEHLADLVTRDSMIGVEVLKPVQGGSQP